MYKIIDPGHLDFLDEKCEPDFARRKNDEAGINDFVHCLVGWYGNGGGVKCH